ncbi:MAG: hypothetical protein JNM09_16985 [Blastocatellia bacterium]|nr:hypothetical protein [Blastocatellia bacterium]
MRVIINASPLIFLCTSGFQDLLPQLYEEIIVPTPVWEEVMAGGRTDRLEELINAGLWISDHVINLLKQQAGE